MTTINSELDLYDYFHSVHSFIRNRFGLYGKAALQFFNFFFVLKVIEPLEIDFNNSLDENDDNYVNCKFTHLCNINDEGEKINQVNAIKRIIYLSKHKDTFFMNFPIDRFDEKKGNLTDFLKKLNLLTPEIMNQYHVYGRVYEYFLGHITGRNSGSRAGSQMEDLGQFFTSRHLVRYCIAKVKPTLINNNVPKMGDFYCGSGGFITEYIRYINYHNQNIQWENNIDHIFGFDTDAEILKSARVDIMTLTKTFSCDSDDNIYSKNFRNVNTFEEDCVDTNNNKIRVHFNFTNPPYGNSGKTTEEDKIKMEKAGKEIKHIASNGSINNVSPPNGFKKTKSKPFLINGDNKETLSLLHGMGVLEKDGIYCGVLKEGCFFDKKFQDLRTNLCKFYEVEYVISVPQDDFLNTSTKTSILIFKNSGKPTNEIKFCELDIIKSNDKIIGFNEINSQTKQIVNTFTSSNYEFTSIDGDYLKVKYDELEKNGFSFNFKNYIKEDIKVGRGFKVVKLGDVFIFPSYEISNENNEGIYNFYTCSNKVKKCNDPKINGRYILMGSRGTIEEAIHLIEGISGCGNNMIIMSLKENNDILLTYIYYYLIYNKHIIKSKTTGSTIPMISKKELSMIEIPIPESIETIKLYLDYLGPANQTLQTLQTLQTQKEASICGKIKLLTMMGIEGVDYDEYRLGDVCEFKAGKFNTKNMTNTGAYPFYNASVNNPIGIHNEFCFDGDKYLLFVKSGGNSNNRISDTHGLAKCYLTKGKSACVSDVIQIKSNIDIDYLYYYLLILKSQIQENSNYSTGLGHVDMNYFKNMSIRILKPHLITQYKLDDDFIFIDRLKNDIQNTLKLQEVTTKSMMSEIFNTGIVRNDISIIESDKVNVNDDNLSEKSGTDYSESKISVIHDEMGIDYNKLIIDLDDVSKIESKSKQTKKKVTKKQVVEM